MRKLLLFLAVFSALAYPASAARLNIGGAQIPLIGPVALASIPLNSIRVLSNGQYYYAKATMACEQGFSLNLGQTACEQEYISASSGAKGSYTCVGATCVYNITSCGARVGWYRSGIWDDLPPLTCRPGTVCCTVCEEGYRTFLDALNINGCRASCDAGTRITAANGACTALTGTNVIAAHTVNYGSTSPAATVCGAGVVPNANRSACDPCTAGSTWASATATTCSACPTGVGVASCVTTGFTCRAGWTTNTNSCTCASDRWIDSSNNCVVCPTNATCNGSTTFTCPSGFDPNYTGAGSCVQQQAQCPVGQFVNASNACENCAANTFQNVANNTGGVSTCQACSTGSPSFQFSAAGASQCTACSGVMQWWNGTACVNAGNGLQANAAHTGTESCAAGYACNNGVRTSCTNGSTFSKGGATTCAACPTGNSTCTTTGFTCQAGRYVNGNLCSTCGANTFQRDNNSSETVCTACPTANVTNCPTTGFTCNAGYRVSVSTNTCMACTGNNVQGSNGSSATTCTACTGANVVANSGKTQCVCDTGFTGTPPNCTASGGGNCSCAEFCGPGSTSHTLNTSYSGQDHNCIISSTIPAKVLNGLTTINGKTAANCSDSGDWSLPSCNTVFTQQGITACNGNFYMCRRDWINCISKSASADPNNCPVQ